MQTYHYQSSLLNFVHSDVILLQLLSYCFVSDLVCFGNSNLFSDL